jgi:Ser/Thr protein kinase RdoA (MazF antagonist)
MSIPLEVRRAYDLPEDEALLDLTHVPSLINLTYVVRHVTGTDREPLVLQRLHPVFGPSVHLDIDAVTTHLAARQLPTPRLIRTRDNALWTTEGSGSERRVWRAQSYVDGITMHHSPGAGWLSSAADLLGRFHGALDDLEHVFVHERPLHDTGRHLSNLRAALASERARNDPEAQSLGDEILRQVEGLVLNFGALPRRVIHGDPKLSNVMFHRTEPARAKCMIDLDTVGRGHLAHELGDALRSWCNPAGEDTRAGSIEPDAFRALMTGYAGACPIGVERHEILSAIDGLETISLELASRFAADVIVDEYFGWDATRFASRREHNLLRARGQLALSRSVRKQKAELLQIAEHAIANTSRR